MMESIVTMRELRQ